MRLVFNASPLIASGKADLLPVWERLFPEYRIPEAVWNEVCAVDNPADPSRRWLEDPSRRVRIFGPVEIPRSVLAWDLGDGESAVLAAAHADREVWAVLDDMAARRCAASMGVRVIGTLGLLFKANQLDEGVDVRQSLERLQEAGLYLPQDLLRPWMG